LALLPAKESPTFSSPSPRSREDDSVYISEHFEWDESDERRELLHFALGKNDAKMRVVLPPIEVG
jgi:hypothetical protein